MVAHAMHIQHHMRGICLDEDAFQKRDHLEQSRVLPSGRQVLAAFLPFTIRFVGSVLAVFASSALGAEDADWRVWLEAKFFAPAWSSVVPGAQRTVLAGGVWDGSKLVPFTKAQASGVPGGWVAFQKAARRAADSDFAQVEIIFQRDKRQVIEFAALRAERPLMPSAVLAGSVGAKFFESFGDVFFLAVPSRTRAFVFPKIGIDLSRYSGMVWEAYRETADPVSFELFEWRQGELRAVGAFDP